MKATNYYVNKTLASLIYNHLYTPNCNGNILTVEKNKDK